MTMTLKYIGAASQYAEIAATGKQSVWKSGQIESRDDAEALLLLGTGLFAVPVATVTAATDAAAKREYPITLYGTISQAETFTTAAMTIGSAVLTVAGHTFASDDIGKTVGVKGPGVGSDTGDFSGTVANDGVLVGTILSVSGDTATLSVVATQTASDCACIIGNTIDAAVAAAVAQCQADYAVDGVAGTVVIPSGKYVASTSIPVTSGVGFSGVHRDSSYVYVVKITDDATDVTKSAWIRRAGGTDRYSNINITQLSLVGTFLAASSVYGADMKMIHMNTTDASSVTWCRIENNPSTALGYDDSTDCELGHNLIIRAGRLARPSTSGSGGGAGGSGIGFAVGDTNVSVRIHHNIIRGSLVSGMSTTAAGATGRSGINIEASADTPNPPAFGGNGVIIESNIIEGYFNGIVDSGGYGTRIVDNIIRKCVHGIKAGSNGVTYGRVARDSLIALNDISELFTWNSQYSIGISINAAPGSNAQGQSGIAQAYGRTRVVNNTIRKAAGGYGIALISHASYPLLGLVVDNNTVADSDLSGIRLVSGFTNLQLTNNTLISNGRISTAGNKAPIRFDTGSSWTNGWFYGNSYLDPESSPTQDAAPTVNNAVLTNVWAAEKVLALINGTVANLPAASSTYKSFSAKVTDASVAYTSANVGSTVAAGGANAVPVFCNGTNWVIG
jgi:hypothetical protein